MSAPQASPAPSPSDQAIAWHVRLHSGTPMDEAEQERFITWLDTPAHQRAWEEVLQLSEQLEQPARLLASDSNHVDRTSPPTSARRWWKAGAALLLSGVALYYLFR